MKNLYNFRFLNNSTQYTNLICHFGYVHLHMHDKFIKRVTTALFLIAKNLRKPRCSSVASEKINCTNKDGI